MLPTKFRFIRPSGFRGEDFFKSANQKQELSMVAMFVDGSGPNEQSLERAFLPSFTSFGWGVSEERIKILKVIGRRTPSEGKSSHWLWQGELKKESRFKSGDEGSTPGLALYCHSKLTRTASCTNFSAINFKPKSHNCVLHAIFLGMLW